MSRQSVC